MIVPRTYTPAHPPPWTTLDSRRNWKRLDGVDVLRGLAILFVVLNHVHMRLAIAHISYVADTSKPLIASLVWNGQFGVQIFFAVSGFLITSTALRRWGLLSNVSLQEFYLLRFARIAPMLLALLALLAILHYARSLAIRGFRKNRGHWPSAVRTNPPRKRVAGASRMASGQLGGSLVVVSRRNVLSLFPAGGAIS